MNDHPVLQVRMIRRLLCAKTYKRLLIIYRPVFKARTIRRLLCAKTYKRLLTWHGISSRGRWCVFKEGVSRSDWKPVYGVLTTNDAALFDGDADRFPIGEPTQPA